MHRNTILKMCQATGMEYDKSEDPACPNSWFIWSVPGTKKWVPSWANGIDPESLYRWMLRQASISIEVKQAMKEAGMRVFSTPA